MRYGPAGCGLYNYPFTPWGNHVQDGDVLAIMPENNDHGPFWLALSHTDINLGGQQIELTWFDLHESDPWYELGRVTYKLKVLSGAIPISLIIFGKNSFLNFVFACPFYLVQTEWGTKFIDQACVICKVSGL
jgi:hypothetical protein